MSDLLEKIYREVIYFESDTVRMENELAEEIEGLTAPYCEKLDEEQVAQFRAVIYEAVFAAEAKAFCLGVKYAGRLSGKL